LSKKTVVIAPPVPTLALKQNTEKSEFLPPNDGIGIDPVQDGLSANRVIDPPGKENKSTSQLRVDSFDDDSKGYIKIGLGVDAGGTYTDAVIFDLEKNFTICKAKSLTTRWDFTVGISKALSNWIRTSCGK
jgi:hypothetical protein